MKKFYQTFALLLLVVTSFAQIPQGFSYQAVLRDANNNLLGNKDVQMQISILQGADNGESIYTETHVTKTNATGLITLVIGQGTTTNDVTKINWAQGPFFIKTETTVDGKSIIGVTPLLCVPYAMYAMYSEKTNATNIVETDPTISAWAKESTKPTYNYSEIANAPTKLSQFENDSNYMTSYTETDPTVSAWAKESTKPTYNYSEIANAPTKVSDLNNDANYVQKHYLDSLIAEYQKNVNKLDSIIKNAEKNGSINTKESGLGKDEVIGGVFSVNENKKVRFSKGNLQYRATTGTWRFAEKQTDYIGADNDNASATYDGWIDLFAYGTSGYLKNLPPYICSYKNTVNSTDLEHSLVGVYKCFDWGEYNSEVWRCFTLMEMNYILNNRNNAEKLCSTGRVNEIDGLILLPDDFVFTEEIVFTPKSGCNANNYTEEQWEKMEKAGAVFLPMANVKNNGVYENMANGVYWTSTFRTTNANPLQWGILSFGDGVINMVWYGSLMNNEFYSYCNSVRLVQDVIE